MKPELVAPIKNPGKTCPFMPSPVYDHEEKRIEYRKDRCDEGSCELWTGIYTTEGILIYGCALRLNAGRNHGGYFVV